MLEIIEFSTSDLLSKTGLPRTTMTGRLKVICDLNPDLNPRVRGNKNFYKPQVLEELEIIERVGLSAYKEAFVTDIPEIEELPEPEEDSSTLMTQSESEVFDPVHESDNILTDDRLTTLYEAQIIELIQNEEMAAKESAIKERAITDYRTYKSRQDALAKIESCQANKAKIAASIDNNPLLQKIGLTSDVMRASIAKINGGVGK